VIFVQSKWIYKGTGEPEAKEIGAFVKGVRDAIEQDDTNFHSRLKARFADIALRLGTPGVRVHLIVVSTGASYLAQHGESVLQDFLKELNGDDPEPIASTETLGLAEVYDGLASDPSQATVPLDATILEWSYVPSPFPAYFGVIDGLQLKGWWKSYGRRVVSGNIRHALGATEVNNEVRQTAASSHEKFWYFNNGITLVADEAWKAPAGAASRSAGVFSFKGASIVNGAQTVRVRASDPYSALVEIVTDSGATVVSARGSRQRELAGQHRATWLRVLRGQEPASALEQYRGKKVGGHELLSDYEQLRLFARAGVLGQLDTLYVSPDVSV
jgi:hypothetical protein